MEAYLDNSATTRVSEAVKDIIVQTMMVDYGNPSSRHQKGVDAERYVRQARERIAATLKVKDREIYFTSGGTESNNWALIGGALANRRAGKHIITTAVEHAAVLQPLSFLKDMGFRITYLPVDEHGHISLDDLKAQLDQDTILVSTMYVNNEIGAVEPVSEIGELVKAYNEQILFHVDAIQAYGKYRIFPEKLHIDMLSVSGHKIHGPKGSGFLYIHEKAKVRPLIYGGGQQRGMRSGTENVPGIAGLGIAAMEAYTDFDRKVDSMRACKKRLMEEKRLIEAYNRQVEIQDFTGMHSTPNAEKIGILEAPYDPESFLAMAKGLENVPELCTDYGFRLRYYQRKAAGVAGGADPDAVPVSGHRRTASGGRSADPRLL